jgi:hypothetical protein
MSARTGFRTVCQPATVVEVCEMSGEPNDANASALVCSGCCTHAASPQAAVTAESTQSPAQNDQTPSRIEELVTAVTRGALRESAVSPLSPTQDHINDLRPPASTT